MPERRQPSPQFRTVQELGTRRTGRGQPFLNGSQMQLPETRKVVIEFKGPNTGAQAEE